ncbi:LOW QUALITY PROTEIN: rho GTPase-activating protein 26-like [Asterias rubens]|uniref:LOW QUALITY PROTEIN: rho GTPase-activating protein 26-like n=1 Tax=Asterias rubens TaxID=7604 RepID=UPI0014550D9B|nr:LOW QUALITY PROTEIN: rho GTPase-activating protein 26-like [Asterias rubens]
MVLQPLEFSECYLDSPEFRDSLHSHENELEHTNKAIKELIRDGKALLAAARNLSKAQRAFSDTLITFNFECIGMSQTDDEIDISGEEQTSWSAQSLKEFGRLIASIEDERDRMLEHAKDQLIIPLEAFRKDQIGSAKEAKKQFEKQTEKFCKSLDNHVGLTTKKKETSLLEADAALELERRDFHRESLMYARILQEVQEKKKFEFVETLLGFMYSWLTFYHQGHEVATEFKPYTTELQLKLQNIRDGFDITKQEAETLMNKMMEVRKPHEQVTSSKGSEGYLYIYEKRALGSNWVKHYCRYSKDTKILKLIPFVQTLPKPTTEDQVTVTSCTRRMTDSIEKRFCFDITTMEKPHILTLQAISEKERTQWMLAMGGKEPIYINPAHISKKDDNLLNDIGFHFIKKCIEAIESRGLEDQGLYRVVGVNSKVMRLTSLCLADKRKPQNVNLSDSGEWEIKTITSALKNYFRNLPEPLMSFRLHDQFIAAAKQETKTLRVNDIHALVHQLEEPNFEMLDFLISHLRRVADQAETNLMTVTNLGVCFGPTLMRPEEETMKAIMDIKFSNIVIEILIKHYQKIFKFNPDSGGGSQFRNVAPSSASILSNSSASSVSSVSSSQMSPRNGKQLPQTPKTDPMSTQRYIPHSQMPSTGRDQSPRRTVVEPQYSSSSSRESISSQSSISTHSSSSSPPSNKKANSLSTVFWRSIQMRKYPKYHTYHGKNEEDDTVCHASKTPPLCLPGSLEDTRQLSVMPLSSRPPHDLAQPLKGAPSTIIRPPLARADEIFDRDCRDVQTRNKSASASSNTSSSSASQSSSSDTSGFQPAISDIRRLIESDPSKKDICVRTLYACDADNESELSFVPNQIIINVKASKEKGWLLGTLNGKTGLVPENYVEMLPGPST